MSSTAEYVGSTLIGNPLCAWGDPISPQSGTQVQRSPPQSQGYITDYLQNVGVERMEWPAKNPDLNPIVHLWDQLGRVVRVGVTNTTTLADLQRLLVEEWNAIPQQRVTRCVTSTDIPSATEAPDGVFNE